MLRFLRSLPALLVLLVGSLSFSVMVAPVAHAADAPAWWDKTVDGVRVDIRDLPVQSAHIVPPFAMRAKAAVGGVVGRGLSAASREGRLFAQGAINTAGAGIALAAAWALSPLRSDPANPPKTVGPTVQKLEALEDHLIGDHDTNTVGFTNQLGGTSVAHQAKDCGWYSTITSGVHDTASGVASILFTNAQVGGDGYITIGTTNYTCLERAAGHQRGITTVAVKCVDGGDIIDGSNKAWGGDTFQSGSLSFSCNRGVPFYASLAYSGSVPLPEIGTVKNNLFDGDIFVFEGHESDFRDLIREGTRQGVEVTCRNTSTGSASVVTAYSPSGSMNATVPACPAGSVPESIRHWIDHPITEAGDVQLGGFEIDPGASASHPDCLGPLAFGCAASVILDGVRCSPDRADCADWWGRATAAPDRASCEWGPYTLPFSECIALAHAYAPAASGGVSATPHAPGHYPPQPVPVGSHIPVTGGFPSGPGTYPSPIYGNPLGCAQGVLTGANLSGLQPIAREGVKCIMQQYPDVDFSSGHRYDYTSPNSDHPRGLAVDLTRPDWNTSLGNTRLWEVASGIVQRSQLWGVRYVIFDNQIWFPQVGWGPYTYSGPATGADATHENHIHVSFGPGTGGQTQPGPGENPYPDPDPHPNPNPNPPGPNPTAPPGTGTGDPPGFPVGGDNPDHPETAGCLDEAWGWNPVDWVVVPVKCALVWAFVPSEDVGDMLADKASALGDTSVGSWLAAPIDVGNAVSAAGGAGPVVALDGGSFSAMTLEDSGAGAPAASSELFPRLRSGLEGAGSGSLSVARSGLAAGESFGTQSFSTLSTCQGPAMTVDLGFVNAGTRTIYPLAACDGPMAAISTIVRVGLAILINSTVLIAIPEMLLSVMGWRRSITDSTTAMGTVEDHPLR